MIVVSALGIALAAGGARAQPTDAQKSAIKSSCRSDYMANCMSVRPGGKEAIDCLRSHLATLSPACQSAVNALTPKPPPAAAAPPPPRAKTRGQRAQTAAASRGCSPATAAGRLSATAEAGQARRQGEAEGKKGEDGSATPASAAASGGRAAATRGADGQDRAPVVAEAAGDHPFL